MRRLIFVVLVFLVPAILVMPAARATQSEAAPEASTASPTIGQFGSGCLVGGLAGVTLSMIGSFPAAVLPAANLGCLLGTVAAAPIADYYNRWVLGGTQAVVHAWRQSEG
jgi:hypothetical protein